MLMPSTIDKQRDDVAVPAFAREEAQAFTPRSVTIKVSSGADPPFSLPQQAHPEAR